MRVVLPAILSSACAWGCAASPAAAVPTRAGVAGIGAGRPGRERARRPARRDLHRQVQAYGAARNQPVTPNISALAARGVLFRNAYGFASSTPARAALLTGRYPTRSGLGSDLVPAGEDAVLPARRGDPPGDAQILSVRLPLGMDRQVAPVSYWYPGTPWGPDYEGFDTWSGSLADLDDAAVPAGVTGYGHWERFTDGRRDVGRRLRHHCDGGRGDRPDPSAAPALARRRRVQCAARAPPRAPRRPLHDQPRRGHLWEPCDPNAGLCYDAMVEAADHGIGGCSPASIPPGPGEHHGRAHLGQRSPVVRHLPAVRSHPLAGTLFDGGCKVPLVVAGRLRRPPRLRVRWVREPRRRVRHGGRHRGRDALDPDRVGRQPAGARLRQLHRRILDPAAVPAAPRNTSVYSEMFGDNGAPPWASGHADGPGRQYKLIRANGVDQLLPLRCPRGRPEHRRRGGYEDGGLLG